MLPAVPETPDAEALPPWSVSLEVVWVSGVPFLAYVSASWVDWLALTLALTTTCALPAPSVWASIALTWLVIDASYFWSACCCVVPPEPLPSDDGHRSEPSEPVTVTLLIDRLGTLEATSCAIPRTELAGSWLPPSSTDAVAGWLWSEK